MKELLIILLSAGLFFNTNAQNVGIGTLSPAEKLDITGNLKISGELKPGGVSGQAGQVLTSNGNGTMQWSSSAPGGSESGNDGWGDCSIYNIDQFFPVGNTSPSDNDRFGRTVNISGDYAIVGATGDDDGIAEGGSATIFKYNPNTGSWDSQGKVFNPDGEASDLFGGSVGISGNYAIVGAPYDQLNGLSQVGSATIFRRNVNTGIWETQVKLLNANPEEGDLFGASVAISGEYAIVGAYGDDESGLSNCGSATIYKLNVNTNVWESQGKILNPAPANDDYFGISASISGDYAIVGAYGDDEQNYMNNGSATIFKRNVSTGVWAFQSKFSEAGYPGNYFGTSVAISGEYAIIGIPGDFNLKGAALILKRNTISGNWEKESRIKNHQGMEEDQFGSYVSINSNGYAAVGCPLDDENGLSESGSVSIFKRLPGGMWTYHQKFTAPFSAIGMHFGNVSLSNFENRFITSAPDAESAKGIAFFGRIK